MNLIFRLCLEKGKFPSEWKCTNVVLAIERNNMEELKNDHPIPLRLVSGKKI